MQWIVNEFLGTLHIKYMAMLLAGKLLFNVLSRVYGVYLLYIKDRTSKVIDLDIDHTDVMKKVNFTYGLSVKTINIFTYGFIASGLFDGKYTYVSGLSSGIITFAIYTINRFEYKAKISHQIFDYYRSFFRTESMMKFLLHLFGLFIALLNINLLISNGDLQAVCLVIAYWSLYDQMFWSGFNLTHYLAAQVFKDYDQFLMYADAQSSKIIYNMMDLLCYANKSTWGVVERVIQQCFMAPLKLSPNQNSFLVYLKHSTWDQFQYIIITFMMYSGIIDYFMNIFAFYFFLNIFSLLLESFTLSISLGLNIYSTAAIKIILAFEFLRKLLVIFRLYDGSLFDFIMSVPRYLIESVWKLSGHVNTLLQSVLGDKNWDMMHHKLDILKQNTLNVIYIMFPIGNYVIIANAVGDQTTHNSTTNLSTQRNSGLVNEYFQKRYEPMMLEISEKGMISFLSYQENTDKSSRYASALAYYEHYQKFNDKVDNDRRNKAMTVKSFALLSHPPTLIEFGEDYPPKNTSMNKCDAGAIEAYISTQHNDRSNKDKCKIYYGMSAFLHACHDIMSDPSMNMTCAAVCPDGIYNKFHEVMSAIVKDITLVSMPKEIADVYYYRAVYKTLYTCMLSEQPYGDLKNVKSNYRPYLVNKAGISNTDDCHEELLVSSLGSEFIQLLDENIKLAFKDYVDPTDGSGNYDVECINSYINQNNKVIASIDLSDQYQRLAYILQYSLSQENDLSSKQMLEALEYEFCRDQRLWRDTKTRVLTDMSPDDLTDENYTQLQNLTWMDVMYGNLHKVSLSEDELIQYDRLSKITFSVESSHDKEQLLMYQNLTWKKTLVELCRGHFLGSDKEIRMRKERHGTLMSDFSYMCDILLEHRKDEKKSHESPVGVDYYALASPDAGTLTITIK